MPLVALPENVLTDPVPAEWDSPALRALLHDRLKVAQRLFSHVVMEDSQWAIDDRREPLWQVDADWPDVLVAYIETSRLGASYESQYVNDELWVTMHFNPGSRVIDVVECDGPGDGKVNLRHVHEERRRSIEEEQQALRDSMNEHEPTLTAPNASSAGSAGESTVRLAGSRRRL